MVGLVLRECESVVLVFRGGCFVVVSGFVGVALMELVGFHSIFFFGSYPIFFLVTSSLCVCKDKSLFIQMVDLQVDKLLAHSFVHSLQWFLSSCTMQSRGSRVSMSSWISLLEE